MRRAFTLIELLVVIAIVAILATILFPVFAQAKLAAKKAASISNLKQYTAAGLLYSGDADDAIVPFQMPATSDWSLEKSVCDYWYGQTNWADYWAGSMKDAPEKGLIYPYMRNAQVRRDPTADRVTRSFFPGDTGYGYNQSFLGAQTTGDWCAPYATASHTAVAEGARTVFLASTAYLASSGGEHLELLPWMARASNGTPMFRGTSGKGQVAWLDGHVSSLAPTRYDTTDETGQRITVATMRKYDLGFLPDEVLDLQ